MADIEVRGLAESSFEPVREVFATAGAELLPGGGAFAAYIDGEKVVDLSVGDRSPGEPWSSDTLAVLFSATKALATLAAQVLVDRGLLDVDAPLSRYWPEMAGPGKDGLLVRHVLSHTSGLVTLPGHEGILSRTWDGTGFDRYRDIARALEQSVPAWEPGSRHGYQALTYGWLIGELVERITGCSLGTFFRTEVAEPWGLDLRIGTPEREVERCATVFPQEAPPPALEELVRIWNLWLDPASVQGQAFLASSDDNENVFVHIHELMNSPTMLQAEVASGAGTGTASGLARMYAGLSLGGELDGVRLLRPETVDRFRQGQANGVDEILQLEWHWALGYHLQVPAWSVGGLPSPLGPNAASFGHAGAGGQIGFADPDRHIGVGFVRNRATHASLLCGLLVAALYRSLDG